MSPLEPDPTSTTTVMAIIVGWVKTPLLATTAAIVFLALFGKSLGVRRLYVRILLQIFEVNIVYIE